MPPDPRTRNTHMKLLLVLLWALARPHSDRKTAIPLALSLGRSAQRCCPSTRFARPNGCKLRAPAAVSASSCVGVEYAWEGKTSQTPKLAISSRPGPFWSNFVAAPPRRIRPKLGRLRPTLGEHRPKVFHPGPNMANLGRDRPQLVETMPGSARCFWPNPERCRPILG